MRPEAPSFSLRCQFVRMTRPKTRTCQIRPALHVGSKPTSARSDVDGRCSGKFAETGDPARVVIRSLSHPKRYYIGFTRNIDQHVKEHNEGKSLHTAKYSPGELASARKLTGGGISKAAGRRKNDVKVNMSPPTFGRRRTMPDSLRPAGTKYDFWPCRLSWRASRSSCFSRAKGE